MFCRYVPDAAGRMSNEWSPSRLVMIDGAAVAVEDGEENSMMLKITVNNLKGGEIMPGFDRTGPWGMGPMTGGRRGLCVLRGRGSDWYSGGRGFGWGTGPRWGRGSGWCRWRPSYVPPYAYAPPMGTEREFDFLRNQSQALREELENIEARISEMEGKEN